MVWTIIMSSYLPLIVLTFHVVDTYITFDHVNYVTDPKVIRMNMNIHNYSAAMALNLDLYLIKEVDGQLMIKFSIFRETPAKLNQVFSLPKTNYCTLLRNSNNIPFIRDFFNEVSKFGNIPLSCPIRKSNYYLDRFTMAGMSGMPHYEKGKYQIHFRLIDENQKSPKLIFRMKAYMRVD